MSESEDYLRDLNQEQRRAVVHTTGPLLVVAGAGSGKTRIITYKIAHLIKQNLCRPDQILAVTFTNKAAEEMRNRVEKLLFPLPSIPLVSTFHSFGVRVLRRHARLLGYRPDFAICDTDDQTRILKKVYELLGFESADLPIREARSVIGKLKNEDWSSDPEPEGDSETSPFYSIYKRYQRFLKESNAMDFDDLVQQTVLLFQNHQDVRETYSGRYRYLLIDEYQDTNPPQYKLVRHLASTHGNITAVGDEDQAIYRFRGADIRNILHFESDFPGATVVKLEQNYRSCQNILDAASAIVANNLERKPKTLWTENPSGDPIDVYEAGSAHDEAFFVARQTDQCLTDGEKGVGILYRANFQSRHFEEVFRRFGIKYRLVGGVGFYHRKEVRDGLAYLRVVYNPHDNLALLRIINEPPRGIGKVTLDRLYAMAEDSHASLWDTLVSGVAAGVFPGRAQKAFEAFSDLIETCRGFLDLPVHLCLEKSLESSGYIEALIRENTEEASNRRENLLELVNVAREHFERGQDLQSFLDSTALHSETDDYDETAAVTLMTLHNAKGLEFPIVFLVGCEQGLLPHSRSLSNDGLEEERRLCYVGVTRSQKKLFLTYCQRRRFFGSDSDEITKPSCFLGEIPSHLIRFPGRSPVDTSSTYDYSTESSDPPFFDESSEKQSPDSWTEGSSTKAFTGRFVKGARIEHPKYGRGRILQVQPTGDDVKVTVQFPGLGIKKLLQSYARLRLV